jgi:hypothetical protein
VDGPRTLVRTEYMWGESQRQHQGEQHRARDDEDYCGGAAVVGAKHFAQSQHQPGAKERRRPAGGRRHRVHRHHLVAGHDVRQRRRKAGGDEAGEAVDDQCTEQDGPVVGSGREQRGDAEYQDQPREVGSDQHGPPVPSVQQCTGEWSKQRVRQVQNRERASDLPRADGTLRVEQQTARQPGLEQAVAELAHRPKLEQSPEFRQAAHGPPEDHRCVYVSHENSQYKYPGGPRLFATLIVRW